MTEVLRMIVLGLVLVMVGFLVGMSILTTAGVILLMVMAVLAIIGSMRRELADGGSPRDAFPDY